MVVATIDEAQALVAELKRLVPVGRSIRFAIEEDLSVSGSHYVTVNADPGAPMDFSAINLGKWLASDWSNWDCRAEMCTFFKVVE